MPGVFEDGRAGLLVGSPKGDVPGVFLAGGGQLYGWREGLGLDTTPLLAVGGETERTGGRLGEWVAGGRLNGRAMIVVASYLASALATDSGAAYVVPLTPLAE